MGYDVLLPDGYTPDQAYPVLLFLHGGNQASQIPGLIDPWFNAPAFRRAYPAIVIAPVLQVTAASSNWGGKGIGDLTNQNGTLAILAQVMAQYSADRNRVYVTGLSDGGRGAWDLMIRYNAYDGLQGRIFAAALPLAGAEQDPDFSISAGSPGATLPTQAVIDQLHGVPIWAVNGTQDAPQFDEAMARALGSDGAFHYTESAAGHDIWDTTYPLPNGAPYYDWLFGQAARLVPPTPPVATVAGFVDGNTGEQGTAPLAAVSGGPSYLQWQFIWARDSGVALASSTPNVFLHGGPGQDSIEVGSGQNVLDGGTGSNFLTGGSGTDTFFTDARGSAVVWNTLRNFHAGDAATLWGFVPGVSSYGWDPVEGGAPGSTGATLRANIVGGAGRSGDGIDASITFAGLSVAQARNLLVASGTQAAGPYLYLYDPGV